MRRFIKTKNLIGRIKEESGIILRGGCAIAFMIFATIGLFIALMVGEYRIASALGLSLIISIIWTLISYAVYKIRQRKQYNKIRRYYINKDEKDKKIFK